MEHIFLPHLPLKNTTLSKSVYVDFPVYVDERWPGMLSHWPESQHSTMFLGTDLIPARGLVLCLCLRIIKVN